MIERDDLEARLLDLGAHVAYPPTPPLATLVSARLASAGVAPRVVPRWRRSLAALLVAAALLAAVVLGVPPVRTTVAHWLGIRGVEVVPVQTLPPIPTRTTTPQEGPAAPGDSLRLGIPLTLAEAQARAGFTPLLPSTLGAPDAVWVRDEGGGIVTLVYLPRPGLSASAQTGLGMLITELRATAPVVQKFVGPQTQVVPVTVGGEPGYWLAAAPTAIGYELPDGTGIADTLRLAGPTLLLQHGDLSVRIEAQIDEARALQYAASLR